MTLSVPNANLNETWTAGVSGDWSVAANWGDDQLPIPFGNVTIDTAKALTVTFDVASTTIGTLTLVDDALNLQGGNLAVHVSDTLEKATVKGVKWFITAGASTVERLTVGGSAVWYNTGNVQQSDGAVAIGDASSSSARITNSGLWVISDASGMTQASSSGFGFINTGTFQKTSGSGIALITANFISTGTIASQGGGDIEFDGKSTRLSGTYIGSGMVDYGPDGVSTVTNVDVTAATCQSNWGDVNLVGTMSMNDGSTIMNASGAKWNFDGDSSLLLAGGQSAGPIIDSMGMIAKTAGTGVSTVGIDVDTQGAVDVATGTLAFEGASSLFFGAIAGAGTFEIAGGSAQVGPDTSLSVKNWTLAGGQTMLGQDISYHGVFTGEADATFAPNGGVLALTGSTELSGLGLVGSGDLIVEGAAKVSGATIGGTVELFDRGSVTQSGGNVTVGDSTTTDAANLSIGYGGVWDIADGSFILAGFDPASSITIGPGASSGLLEKSGVGRSIVAPAVRNMSANVVSKSGVDYRGAEASSGTLDFAAAVSGTGSANIVGAGTLEFDNNVTSGQTVSFFGAGGTLDLTDLFEFHAAVVGFDTTGSNDTILIGGGWTYKGASETASAATLSFSQNGAAPATLTLTGDYVGGTFTAHSQGGGALKITY